MIHAMRGCRALLAAVVLGAAASGGCAPSQQDEEAVDFVFGEPGLGAGEFSYPRSLSISPVDGRVFVVDKSAKARIQRFSPEGKYELEWHMPEAAVGKPTGLYVDRSNRVWVADTHYFRVVVFDRDGREQFRFGEQGEGPGQFILPTTVALDRDGNIYVGEYGGNDRISKFSPERKYLFSFADQNSGEASVQRPTEIIIDEQDILWVADGCHHRICRYDRDGKFLGSFGSTGDPRQVLKYPYGMTMEKRGTLLVADRGNNRIVRFGRDGKFLGSWGRPGRGRGELGQPWDVAVGPDGRVFCLDSWNNRVQVIEW